MHIPSFLDSMCLFRYRYGLSFRPVVLGGFLVLELANEVDNDIVFLDAQIVEVFSDGHCEALLILSAFLASKHRRRVHADPAGLREHSLVECAGEGAGSVEAVLAAVGVKSVSLKGRPLKL